MRLELPVLYVRFEPTTDAVLHQYGDPAKIDLNGAHRDLVFYRDEACAEFWFRSSWYTSMAQREINRRTRRLENIIINCCAFRVVWVPAKEVG